MWTFLAVQIAHLLNWCWLHCTIPKKEKRLLWKLRGIIGFRPQIINKTSKKIQIFKMCY